MAALYYLYRRIRHCDKPTQLVTLHEATLHHYCSSCTYSEVNFVDGAALKLNFQSDSSPSEVQRFPVELGK